MTTTTTTKIIENAKNRDDFADKISLKRPTIQTLEAGQSIDAYVISVLPDGVKVSIRPEIKFCSFD